MSAKKVNAGEERLAIIVSSNDEVVVERIGLVPLLVAERSQVICILFDRMIDSIIMKHTLSGQLLQLAGSLLKI